MAQVFRWLASILAGVVLLAAGIAVFVTVAWLLSRAVGPSKVEREALALIDTPPPRGERDGFAALYTVSHDVPQAEQAAVLAEDVRRFSAFEPLPAGSEASWRSALLDWPASGENRAEDPDWCSLRESGCLQRVRANPDAYAGLLERNAVLLDRTAALADWDHFRNSFPMRFDTPLPAYAPWTRLSTRDAWRFTQGDVDAGLAGACAGVSQGRTLIVAGDSLIGSMVGAALIQGNATLLAEMLAELPRKHALPQACHDAFAQPLPVEDGVCRMMLMEGRYITEGLRHDVTATIAAGDQVPAWITPLFFDPERTAARGAPKFAWHCSEQARELIARDEPLLDPTPLPSPRSLACVSNAAGCIVTDIAAPAYGNYGVRLQDVQARMRTMAALLWLREQEGGMDANLLAQWPSAMQSPSRSVHLNEAHATLGTALFEPGGQGSGGQDDTWSVPLPASRIQPAADSSASGR